jgi:hypothetical protein
VKEFSRQKAEGARALSHFTATSTSGSHLDKASPQICESTTVVADAITGIGFTPLKTRLNGYEAQRGLQIWKREQNWHCRCRLQIGATSLVASDSPSTSTSHLKSFQSQPKCPKPPHCCLQPTKPPLQSCKCLMFILGDGSSPFSVCIEGRWFLPRREAGSDQRP